MSRVLKHSGHVAHFGYTPNHEHNGDLRMRTSGHEMALRMLAAAPDDGKDRFNYRMLVACLQAAGLTQWLVQDGNTTRLNCYDQGQTSACTGHGRSMQIAHEDATNIVIGGQPEQLTAMPAPEVQYPFGLEIDGTLGHDDGCSGSGIVEGTERYGSWYEMNVAGCADALAAGNWAGSTSAAVWYARLEAYATHGVPTAIAAAASQHKSASHANVTTVQQAWAAIGNSYPILICSNISFEANRNAEGIIGMTGHDWPHCMMISSRRTSPTFGRLYLVHNSWTPTWASAAYLPRSARRLVLDHRSRPRKHPLLPVGPADDRPRLLDQHGPCRVRRPRSPVARVGQAGRVQITHRRIRQRSALLCLKR